MKTQRKIIREIWWKIFKTNKQRNIIVIMAIILTTILLTSIMSLGASYIEANKQQQIQLTGTVADANISNLSVEQYETIKNDNTISAYGEQRTIGSIDAKSLAKKNARIILHYYDKDEWNNLRKATISNLKGNYPQRQDDIILPESALFYLGIKNPQVGMKIDLSYSSEQKRENKSFTLSGYFKEYVTQRAPNLSYVLVAEAFAKKHSTANNTISVKYQNKEDIKGQNEKLATKLKLSDNQEVSATLKESDSSVSLTSYLGIGVFILIILLSGDLLIYNVLYISIANDIKFYGLLKALGTTSKQIRTIIIRQSLLLSAIGIPIGLLLGLLVSFIVVPFTLKITNFSGNAIISLNPLIYIGTILFTLIVTLFSSIKPAKIAANVSPMVAISYTEATVKKKKVYSNSGAKIHMMAWRNLFRDRKRAIIVSVSLFLGVSLFIATNSAVKSMDLEKFVSKEIDSDIVISQLQNNDSTTRKREDRALVSQLKKIDGITKLQLYREANILVDYQPKKYAAFIKSYNETFKYGKNNPADLNKTNFTSNIVGIDSGNVTAIMKKYNRPFNQQDFEQGKFALVQSDTPDDFKSIPKIAFELIGNKKQLSLKVGGFFPTEYLAKQSEGAPTLLVSQSYLNKIVLDAPIFKLTFNMNKDLNKSILKRTKQLVKQQPYYEMISKEDQVKQARETSMTIRILGNTLALILALIGLLNFVNIITTGIISRQNELATLESIGMTRKQLNKMLAIEGFYYGGITTVLVLTFGLVLTYYFFKAIKESASYAIFNFPLVELVSSLLLVFIICLITPIIVMHFFGRDNLANRIK